MGAKELSERNPCWVAQAALTGSLGEASLDDVLQNGLSQDYTVEHLPSKLSIYPSGRGICPAFKITHRKSGKSIFVEHKAGNNGGNAHERVYKYCLPAIQETVQQRYNTPNKPFVFVFSGSTFQQERYREELATALRDERYIILDPGNTNAREVINVVEGKLS